ncbi:hypothetical protein C5S53_15980 [Methanophagales archaeon]|nr:hypothetical protein C5S53_15980 [Methanophagales archaeon]
MENIGEKDGNEKRVTISFVLAGDNKIVHDARTDIFLQSIRVMHTIASDWYHLQFGPIEVQMPRSIGKQMVEDMLMMLEQEDRREILKVVEENL